MQFYERFGSYYNGRLNEFRVRTGYRANERLSFSVGPQWNRFRLPLANGNFSVISAPWKPTRVRLRWNYRPDSDLYVIYTAGQKFASLAATNPAQFYENRFVVKYTYSFRP